MMTYRTTWAIALTALAVSSGTVAAQEVVYREENGVTYRETSQVVRRQMPVTQYQDSERTILRGQWKTDTQDVVRTYQVPITEYRWETYWQGRYNPFVQPTLAQRMVPITRWETRTEVVKVPVTRYETVPEKTTVKLPITTWHPVEDRVIHRVAVAARPVNAPAVATHNGYGGVAQLNNSPPRSGDNSQWRAPSGGSATALSR